MDSGVSHLTIMHVQANDIFKDLHHQSKAVKAWKTILNLRDDKIRKNQSKK